MLDLKEYVKTLKEPFLTEEEDFAKRCVKELVLNPSDKPKKFDVPGYVDMYKLTQILTHNKLNYIIEKHYRSGYEMKSVLVLSKDCLI